MRDVRLERVGGGGGVCFCYGEVGVAGLGEIGVHALELKLSSVGRRWLGVLERGLDMRLSDETATSAMRREESESIVDRLRNATEELSAGDVLRAVAVQLFVHKFQLRRVHDLRMQQIISTNRDHQERCISTYSLQVSA